MPQPSGALAPWQTLHFFKLRIEPSMSWIGLIWSGLGLGLSKHEKLGLKLSCTLHGSGQNQHLFYFFASKLKIRS